MNIYHLDIIDTFFYVSINFNDCIGSEEEPGLVTKLIMKLLGGCLPMYKKRIKHDVSCYLLKSEYLNYY